MAASNSTAEFLLMYQLLYQVAITEGLVTKVTVTIIILLFFTYLNAIMVYALCSKPVFKETPRYILFIHMLINDLMQLLFTSSLYILAVAYFKLVMAACAFLVLFSSTTFSNAPLNLAVMSLERFVAVRFPLRHAEIVTQKRTYIAIGIIWFIGSINFIIDFFYAVVVDSSYFTSEIVCTRQRIFLKQWQVELYKGFTIFLFVSVSMIIFFTYISILITARSISTNKDSAAKAHKTVLIHFFQLGLCLTSFLFGILEQAAAMAGSISLFIDLRYLIYLFVVILPRCLSPLIYGLRDDAVRPLFMYYFSFSLVKRKSTVNVH